MKFVIDIPEETKEFIDNTSFVDYETNIFDPTLIITDKKKTITILDMLDSIRNGTLLPKGHGDLKDVNDIWNNIPDVNVVTNHFTTYDIQHFIDDAPTIIEKESD